MTGRVLSYRELREVHTTVHECLELRKDPYLWRRHFLRRMRETIGARVGLHTRLPLNPFVDHPRQGAIEVGWSVHGDRDHFMAYLEDGLLDQDPLGQDVSSQLRVRRRQEQIDDDQWYRSSIVMDYYRAARIDHAMTAQQLVNDGQCHQITNVLREWGDKPFSIKDRRKFALTWATLKRYLDAGELSDFGDPRPSGLPKRTRQVFVELLEGKSVKQIAMSLDLSPHTIQDHVKRLHRDLGVQSRGELVSRYACLAEALSEPGSVSMKLADPQMPRPNHWFHVYES